MALKFRDTLRMQRQALEARQELLGRDPRIARGRAGDRLRRPHRPRHIKEHHRGYRHANQHLRNEEICSDEAWEQHRRYYEEGPSAEWRDLYTDARALLNSDAAGDEAQALVQRCYDLSRRARSGNPEVQTDSPEAWMDRANWPEAMKQRAAEFQMPRVISFIRRAELTSRKSCFSARTWAKMVELSNLPEEEKAAQWRSKVELFHDLEGALGEDPVGEIAQALVARWRAQLDWFTGGDAEIKAHLRTGWSRRRYWPDSQHWQIERLHMMSYERFERAADFLDRAIAAADAPKVQ